MDMNTLAALSILSCIAFTIFIIVKFVDGRPITPTNWLIAATLYFLFATVAGKATEETTTSAKVACAAVEAQAVNVAGHWQCIK